MHKNKDYGQPLPTFSVILNRYAEHIRVSLPRHAPRIGHAAFQGKEPDTDNASNNTSNNASNNRSSNKKYYCLCESDPD